MPLSAGLDFGTTNSVLGVVDDDGNSCLITFNTEDTTLETFRSILFFDEFDRNEFREPVSYAGPEALNAYLTPGMPGRLIQSLKTHLTNKSFRETRIFGTRFTLEEMVALIIRRMRETAENAFGAIEGPVVVGRPVRFKGQETDEDETRALSRLAYALDMAGFKDVVFAYEPVGAAYDYESRLEEDELVLIADFGGGTSDFCLLRVGPGAAETADPEDRILGVSGLGIGGDGFDASIVTNTVAPHFGEGRVFRNSFGKDLPVPGRLYSQLENWHLLSFLDTPQTHRTIDELIRGADDSSPFVAFKKLIEERLGFRMYQMVEATKRELSEMEEARIEFSDTGIPINVDVSRAAFEGWILEDLLRLSFCVEELLASAGVIDEEVDRVFLTGGSSCLPSIRALFAERFGDEKLAEGEALTSVANGLAIIARDRNRG